MNAEARSSLGFRHQRGEKDDGRSLQLRIAIDLSRYLASIFPWHHYVQQDQVGPEIVGTLMSFNSVVLFEYDVASFFFQKDFEQVSTVPVVINNQDAFALLSLPTPNKISYTGPRAVVSHRQIILKKMVPPQSDRIGPIAYPYDFI